jgi:predicted amidohydrolase YtcJ
MREEYMIERQGKRFVLYAGLLEEAHTRGLRSIETELLQVPGSGNGEVAIVRAVVRTEDGKFTGIGDASPQNVNRTIAPHVIRMAETRAKARALRDAINVGVTAFEELGGPGEESEAGEVAESSPRVFDQDSQQAARAQREENRGELPATKKQLNYLEALISDVVDEGVGKFEEMVGKPVNELTREEASEWISRLSGRAA